MPGVSFLRRLHYDLWNALRTGEASARPSMGFSPHKPTVLPRRRASHRARFAAALARAPDALARGTGSSIGDAKHGTRSPFPRQKAQFRAHFFTHRDIGGGVAAGAATVAGRPSNEGGSGAMLCPHTHNRPTRCADEGACMARQPWPLLE